MILCITHSQDIYTIDIVQQHLKKMGMPSFRLNTDEFASYSFTYSLQDKKKILHHHESRDTLDIPTIKAVWYRKLWDFKIPPDLDPTYLPVFKQEYQSALQILFHSLAHLPWINNMHTSKATNGNKLFQLETARQSGLNIPRTILSNSPQEVRDFFTINDGKLIMKLHGGLEKNMDGKGAFFPTTYVREEDLSELESLSYCPMIFQQAIDKQYELRIIYIEGIFYSGKIITPPNQLQGTTDWRASTTGSAKWEPYELPVEVKRKIIAMMQSIGLSFGAIDMIRQPDGQYIFLEVNPEGEWGMLQRDLHYPIGETIAESLLQKI